MIYIELKIHCITFRLSIIQYWIQNISLYTVRVPEPLVYRARNTATSEEEQRAMKQFLSEEIFSNVPRHGIEDIQCSPGSSVDGDVKYHHNMKFKIFQCKIISSFLVTVR